MIRWLALALAIVWCVGCQTQNGSQRANLDPFIGPTKIPPPATTGPNAPAGTYYGNPTAPATGGYTQPQPYGTPYTPPATGYPSANPYAPPGGYSPSTNPPPRSYYQSSTNGTRASH